MDGSQRTLLVPALEDFARAAGEVPVGPVVPRLDVTARLSALRHLSMVRDQRVLLLSGITGIATGALVAAFDWLTT